MKLVQEDIPFQLEVIDIETDETLHEKFMLMIPVVEIDNEIVQYGQIEYPIVFEALMNLLNYKFVYIMLFIC